ncbi:MAG: tetratricopeptide repeat protein [Gammaproteobacteria bacterium]
MTHRILKQLILVLTGLACISAQPAKLEDQLWLEITSDNFTLHTTLETKEAIDVLHYLELLRAAVPVVTNIASTESPIPTTIIAVRNIRELKKLGLGRNYGGAFYRGVRNNLIVLRDSKFHESSGVAMHEYVHYLTRNGSSQEYPRWYSEGFAEYFGTAVLNGNSFEIGRFPAERARQFRNCDWLHLAKVIANTGSSACMFYPASWAAVHYIQSMPNHVKLFSDYLQRVEQGEDDVEAFSTAFDVNITTFNFQIKQYVKKGKFSYIGIPADELLTQFETDTRPLLKHEVTLLLAQAAFRMGKLDNAQYWFELAANYNETRAEAEAGIGDVHKYQKDYESAEPHFIKAVELAPENINVLLDMGEYWLSRARAEKDNELRDMHLKTARKYFGKAWKLDDTGPETYAMYGRSFLLQENFEKSIDTLEAANRILPSDINVRMDLAEAYTGLGQFDDARGHARAVRAWSHDSSSVKKKAEELLKKIDASP